jgi:hypothetical protein
MLEIYHPEPEQADLNSLKKNCKDTVKSVLTKQIV